jgi:predicted MFS family arabinose efflux permease
MVGMQPRIASEQERRAYERNIWKSYAFQFLYSFQLWWPIWVIYLTDYRGFSLTQVGSLEAVFWVVIIFSQLPTGLIADSFGRKTSLMLAGVFTTAAILVFGIAANYWIVLVSYVVWGVGLTFASGADSALVFDSLKALGRENEYQRVAGVQWGMFSLGTMAGMLAGAPLAAVTNLSFPVVISAVTCAMTIVVAFSLVEPPIHEGARPSYRELIVESGRTIWRSPAVRSMLVLAALLMASLNATIVFSQPFLDQHDVPVRLFGVAQTPMRVAAIAGSLVAYRLTARLGMRWTLTAATLLSISSYAVLGGWNSVYAFGATTTILLANGAIVPATTDYLNQRIPSSQRATILSARQFVNSIVIAAGLPALGVVADRFSLQAVFWCSAIFLAIAAPPALVFWLRADASSEARALAAAEPEPAPAGG